MKVSKTLSVDIDIARLLSQEDNQSELVECLLREHYNEQRPMLGIVERFVYVLGHAIEAGELVEDEDYTVIHEDSPDELVCVKMQRAVDKVKRYGLRERMTVYEIEEPWHEIADRPWSPVVDSSRRTYKLDNTVAIDPAAIPHWD